MADLSNRTFVSSILFLDIVEYSERSVTEQLVLKQRFNDLLVSALQYVAPTERIILDTGDGAAISFQGNPEDALFAAMALRDAIAAEPADRQPPLEMRTGINLGPIRLIRDLNGQMNMIGDGINVAQRVMSFSAPGEILVSRSYYEVVSRLSDDYFRIFQDAGTRTDKHVREHEVYAIGSADGHLLNPNNPDTRESTARAGQPDAARTAAEKSAPNRQLTIGAIAGAIILIGAAALFWPRNPTPPAIARTTPEPSPQASGPAKKTEPKTETKAETKADAAPPQKVAADKPAAAPVAKAKPEAAAPKQPEAAAKGTVELSILPWGEIYVDGHKRGVSPPLKSLALTPGQHVIEVRNTTLPTHTETVDVKAGATANLRHKF